MEQARKSLAVRDYRDASISARSALMFNPTNLEACAMMAYIAEAARLPQEVDWRKRIVDLAPTLQNRLSLASAALRIQSAPYVLASQILEDVSIVATNLPMFHVVAAELALRTGQPELAATHFQQAISLEPTNERHVLNLAIIHLRSTNSVRAAEARETLTKLRCSTNTGAAALRLLVVDGLRRTNYASAEAFSKELLVHPGAVFDDRVLYTTVLKATGDPTLPDYFAELKKTAVTNAAQVFVTCAWLIANDRAEEALRWISGIPGRVREEPPVPFAFVDCYVTLKDWAGLEAYLQNQKWAETEFMRLAFLSRAAQEQKQLKAADTRWRAAVREAGDRLGSLAALLGMASAWGRPEAREGLLWQITERFPRERWALKELDRYYTSSLNTRGLNKLYATIAAAETTNTVVQNNFAATSLLLRQHLSRAHELAKQNYDRDPDNLILASTYAFSLYRQGRAREALGVFERFKPDTLARQPVALYYGIVLAATGATNNAARYLAVARNSPLLPEEETLLAEAQKQSPQGP